MRSHTIILITLLCFVLEGFHPSSGARVLENVVPNAGFATLSEQADKAGMPCHKRHMKPWSSSLKNETNESTKLMLRFKENGSTANGKKESTKTDRVLCNAFPSGRPRRPGSKSRRGDVFKRQRLSSFQHSAGFGRMQFYNSGKSRHRQQQKGASKKRILGSTPSPGDGH